MDRIELAHQMYREGKFEEALEIYTVALDLAISDAQRIAFYSNRAACFLRLHQFKLAAEECAAVLAIDCNHTNILMLRAQTLIALKDYRSALFDVTRLVAINPKLPAYRELENRLRTQLMTLATIPESEDEYVGSQSPPAPPPVKSPRSFSPTTVLPDQPQEKHDELTDDPKLLHDKQKGGCESIPKPRSHSSIDYSKWNNIGDDESDDDDEDSKEKEDSAPQYRYRLRTVGLRAVGSS